MASAGAADGVRKVAESRAAFTDSAWLPAWSMCFLSEPLVKILDDLPE